MYIKRERRYNYLSANRLRYARLRGWLHYDHCAGYPVGASEGPQVPLSVCPCETPRHEVGYRASGLYAGDSDPV